MAVHQRRKGVPPSPRINMTIVGQNEICNKENVFWRFFAQFFGS